MSETSSGKPGLTREQLADLSRHFDEDITFSRHIRAKVKEAVPGEATLYIDVQDFHLNGAGTLHGGVYASLIDNTMGLALISEVGVRTATIDLNVRFLGAVREGRVTCRAEVVHRTRRLATLEARVHDDLENLVALGSGTFRIFEKQGRPLV
ncbi:PaaI family thioesterase [Rubrobacter indicoceani]|uniref:PaaI family thioesterase n=1 Tax=Rubrobacter indicoceani TaxID=2051957 RepID=UPI000E5BED91|nr:PaaI family thioesterase [Rubrobacter indicoceani]